MFIQTDLLLAELKKHYDLQTYNMTPTMISGFAILPSPDSAGRSALESDILYVCDAESLRRLDPGSEPPLILCVLKRGESIPKNTVRSLSAILVPDQTVEQVLLRLSEITYAIGSVSSPLTDASRKLSMCSSIHELMDAGFSLLGNPLIVTDTSQQIVEYTPYAKVSSSIYQEVIQLGRLPEGHPLAATGHDPRRRLDLPYYEMGYDELPNIICKRISLGSRTLGYLHVLQFDRALEMTDIPTVELLGNLIAAELGLRREDHGAAQDQKMERFLRDILENGLDEAAAARRQQELGLSLKSCLYTVILRANRSELVPRVSFHELAHQLAQKLPDCCGFLFRNSVLLVLQSDRVIDDMNAYLRPILPELARLHLAAGVSNCFYSPAKLASCCFQSGKAQQLGSVLDGEKNIYLYRDYAAYYLMELFSQRESPEMLWLPELDPLLEHSAKDGGELLHTLKVYLDCGRSKTRTARRMFIHLNTVKYRVAQFQELLGLDLEEGDNALNLMLSLKLLEYREKYLRFDQMM